MAIDPEVGVIRLIPGRLGVALATLALVTAAADAPLAAVRARRPSPPPAPTGLTATPGNGQVALAWLASTGASSYTVYRRAASDQTMRPVASGITTRGYVDTGLPNGVRYYYRVQAVAGTLVSKRSARVSAVPTGPPPATAPANLMATAGNARVTLTWQAVAGASGYRVYRSTTGTFGATPLAKPSSTTFADTTAANGTTYFYVVAAFNGGGTGPVSTAVSATPMAPPAVPTGLTATAGDAQVSLTWTASAGAATYNVYRGTTAGGEGTNAVATGLTTGAFLDTGRTNGVTYFYKVTALSAYGESARSAEASATPQAAAPPTDLATLAAFRFLRQATWGPKPGDVERLKTGGTSAFFNEQFAAAPSVYPDALLDLPVEWSQEHFMTLGMTGPDQLRQRMAWTLHKIWVVSAVEVDSAPAVLGYYRLLMTDAFGNYRTLMRDMTLNPAMGRYLNMLNNTSQAVTGAPANENYARELLQLFTLGLVQLNPDGTPQIDPATGLQKPTYAEADVKALARIFTGWTFGDGNATAPTDYGDENFLVPMEPVARHHDSTAKTFLGASFPSGQSALTELNHALDVIFSHPNLGPFVARQIIQQLVTSNPSPAYVAAVAGVFNDNGNGVRGDLAAVVRAVLTHPEAAATTATSGKLAEPVLFVLAQLRALDAAVTDHPFMTDKATEMGQKVFYPPSVFSYFSPGFRVRNTGTPSLVGPEFQQLTAVTALIRANFVSSLLGGYFGNSVTVDYSAFTSRAANAAALVDYTSGLVLGGRLSPTERDEIIRAVSVTPATDPLERTHTALYLMLVLAQNQVDR